MDLLINVLTLAVAHKWQAGSASGYRSMASQLYFTCPGSFLIPDPARRVIIFLLNSVKLPSLMRYLSAISLQASSKLAVSKHSVRRILVRLHGVISA